MTAAEPHDDSRRNQGTPERESIEKITSAISRLAKDISDGTISPAIFSDARVRMSAQCGNRLNVQAQDEVGQLSRAFTLMTHAIEKDILARENVEAALRESEDRYRSLIESANEAIRCFSLGNSSFSIASKKGSKWKRRL